MEKPILFSGEMVKAILDGRKTQTRRVIKLQPGSSVSARAKGVWQELYKISHPTLGLPGKMLACPYGSPGDTLWVRETWASHKYMDDTKPSEFTAGAQMLPVWYRADDVQNDERGKWRPSIFMRRWASRITLRVVDVRVEQVQDISDADAIAEGIEKANSDSAMWKHCEYTGAYCFGTIDPRKSFAKLWGSINAKRGYGWDSNPWVWVVKFEEVS